MDKLAWPEMKLAQFSERLAGAEPVPGGGGAAAYTGALGAALIAMVASLTVGKKKYADVQEEVRQLEARANELRLALQQGVEQDAAVFFPLARAYRLPEGTPAEQQAKTDELSVRSRAAAELPLRLARYCHDGLKLAVRMAEIGSMLAVSDVVCGAGLLLAALKGLLMMVSVNLPLVTDEEYVQKAQQEYGRLLVEGTELEAKVAAVVNARADQLL